MPFRDLVVEDALETLKARTNKAVDTLVKLLDEPNPVLQRQVSNDILSHVARYREMKDIENRLEALEKANIHRGGTA